MIKLIKKCSYDQIDQKVDDQVDQKVDDQIDQKVDDQTDQKVDDQTDQKVDDQVDQKVFTYSTMGSSSQIGSMGPALRLSCTTLSEYCNSSLN